MEFGELTSSAYDTEGSISGVELRVDASHDDVRLVRLLTSGVATQAGFTIDEIEAARLVVDEACVILLDICQTNSMFGANSDAGLDDDAGSTTPTHDATRQSGDVLVVRCERARGELRVTVSRPTSHATSNPMPVSTRVLDGLASRWSVRLDGAPEVMVLMRTRQ